MKQPLLSVIVAARNDEATVGLLLSDLSRLAAPNEVIVVDGGSTDFTAAIARAAGARMPRGPVEPGRSAQLRVGAAAAKAPLLLFLDAHARLDGRAVRLLDELAVARPPCAMAFRSKIAARGATHRLAERWAEVRTRRLGLPRPDQGLLVRREHYLGAGGFPRLPELEHIAMAAALRKVARIHLLEASVEVPSRSRTAGRRRAGSWIHLIRHLVRTLPTPSLNATDAAPPGESPTPR